MSRNVVFDQKMSEVVKENMDIFKYEFKNIKDKDWEEYNKNSSCGSCVAKIINGFKKDVEKTNKIFSFILKEDVIIHFQSPIESPMIKEFDSIVEMEAFLKELKDIGKIIRNVNPSPNGKGGYLMVVM